MIFGVFARKKLILVGLIFSINFLKVVMQPAQHAAKFFSCGLHKIKAFSIKNATQAMFRRFLGKKK